MKYVDTWRLWSRSQGETPLGWKAAPETGATFRGNLRSLGCITKIGTYKQSLRTRHDINPVWWSPSMCSKMAIIIWCRRINDHLLLYSWRPITQFPMRTGNQRASLSQSLAYRLCMPSCILISAIVCTAHHLILNHEEYFRGAKEKCRQANLNYDFIHNPPFYQLPQHRG